MTKPKRRPRRLRLLLIVCIALLLVMLVLHVGRDVPPTSTSAPCVGVDPQNVGNMVDKGAMVVGCLENAGVRNETRR